MKKLFAILLVTLMMMSLVACGSQELTMEELVNANKTETLLESYDSVYIRCEMDGEFYEEYYMTDIFSYEKNKSWSMYLSDDIGYACVDGVYQRIAYLNRNGLVDLGDYRAKTYADIALSQETASEKIESVEEAGNQLTVKSFVREHTLEKMLDDKSVRRVENTYAVDAATHAVISENSVLTYDNGDASEFITECSYNAELPEEIKPLIEYANQTEDLRTITLVFHVGTDKETVEQLYAPKGHIVSLVLPHGSTDEEYFSLYADEACTELFKSNGDYTSDITVYVN